MFRGIIQAQPQFREGFLNINLKIEYLQNLKFLSSAKMFLESCIHCDLALPGPFSVGLKIETKDKIFYKL